MGVGVLPFGPSWAGPNMVFGGNDYCCNMIGKRGLA